MCTVHVTNPNGTAPSRIQTSIKQQAVTDTPLEARGVRFTCAVCTYTIYYALCHLVYEFRIDMKNSVSLNRT